ncbi:hypothetical protein DAPPUDRAFT_300460 [Daphnia pulex]|uniref:THAP-type domain-containing protein n=1 Tax=Daphnia pulex TaxID=6669 RepID=E9G546_DAPPU|nr:hypothetical protein DAPPUDRAFT_300460 [Daphnia pulex]|eukprot:EFX85442.1 hypothetical protein DAPPUDRAFT_300460 [Daphnia pulex]
MRICHVAKCGRKISDGVKLYHLPRNSVRRQLWLDKIKRREANRNTKIKNISICSKHFYGGKPAKEIYPRHPDYVPSLLLGDEPLELTDSPLLSVIQDHSLPIDDCKDIDWVPSPMIYDVVPEYFVECILNDSEDPLSLPDGSDLPNPTTSVPESSINFSSPIHTFLLTVDRPLTRHIVVQDKISIPNKPTPSVELNLNCSLSNLVTPTVQNYRMEVSSSASCKLLDHSYVLVPPKSPTSPGEGAAASSTSRNSQSATSQEPQENAAPYESDHNYVLRSSSTPTVNESEESLHLDMAGYRNFIDGVATPTADWTWSFNERNNNLVCSCHFFSHDGVMTIKSVKIITRNKVALYLNAKLITPQDIQLEFRSKAELAKILEDFHHRKICQGIVDDSLADVEVTDKCARNKEDNLWCSKMRMEIAGSNLCSNLSIMPPFYRLLEENYK